MGKKNALPVPTSQYALTYKKNQAGGQRRPPQRMREKSDYNCVYVTTETEIHPLISHNRYQHSCLTSRSHKERHFLFLGQGCLLSPLIKCFRTVLCRKCGSFQNVGTTNSTHSCLDYAVRDFHTLRYLISTRVWGIASFIHV